MAPRYFFVEFHNNGEVIKVDETVSFKRMYLAEYMIRGADVDGSGIPNQTHYDLEIDADRGIRTYNWTHSEAKRGNRIPLMVTGSQTHQVYNPPRHICDSVVQLHSFKLNFFTGDGTDVPATFTEALLLFELE